MANNLRDSGVDFKQQQAAFTAYIRNPSNHPMLQGVQPERMAIYAELLFNNIESFLSGNFPVIKKIHSTEQWLKLVRDFYSSHSCKTPYFAEIPQEFLKYLQEERNNQADYPFLLELAHYEWVELALAIDQEELVINHDLEDFRDRKIKLSPLAWLLAYQYPVQQISPEFLPAEAPIQATYLVVHRDQNHEVKFIKLNPLAYALVQTIEEHEGNSATENIRQISEQLGHASDETIQAGGLQILEELARKHIVTVM